MPRWWYVFPALLAFASIVFAVWTIERAHRYADDALHRGIVPGQFMVDIGGPGEIILFNEVRSRIDGELVDSGQQRGLLALLEGPDGQILPARAALDVPNYKVNGAHGLAIAAYTLASQGPVQVEGFYSDASEPEIGVFAIIRRDQLERLDPPWWPVPTAAILIVLAIVFAGMICHSRIRLLVDHESRAVPTMSSTTLPAPMWRRMAATLIDVGAVIGLMMILSPVLVPFVDWMNASPSTIVRAAGTLGLIILLLGYYVLPEAKFGGTVGKFIMSLRTVTAEGRRLGLERSIVRNLMRAIDLMPFCYLAGGIAHLVSRNNRRIGDIAADTMVVVR